MAVAHQNLVGMKFFESAFCCANDSGKAAIPPTLGTSERQVLSFLGRWQRCLHRTRHEAERDDGPDDAPAGGGSTVSLREDACVTEDEESNEE